MAGSANRRRRQSDGAHRAAESRSASKQQTNPARTTRIRFHKVSALPDSFLTPRRSPQNEGMTELPALQAEPAMQDQNVAGNRRAGGDRRGGECIKHPHGPAAMARREPARHE